MALHSDIQLHVGDTYQISRGAGDDLELGLEWDFTEGMPVVDLDAQAVLFDEIGNCVDAAFYNQLSAAGGAVRHSGDNKTGHGEGDDETITIDVDALPPNVETIVFVVTAYQGGSFVNVESANATLRDLDNSRGGAPRPLVDISIGCHGNNTALVLCAMHKNEDGTWVVKDCGVPANGKHFQECMPVIRAEVDKFLDEGMKGERVLSMDKTFQMHKDESAAFPPGCPAALIGLGWSCPGSIDLDASIVCLGADKERKNIIYYGNKSGSGITHAGDNTTGDGEGDDELIRINFDSVPADILECHVTVNIYSSGYSFGNVHDAYVRLCAANNATGFDVGHELARYKLDGSLPTRGLVFARLYRGGAGGSWHVQALGWGCGGPTASSQECLDVVQGKVPPTAFTPGPPAASASAATAAASGGGDDSGGCCTIA